MSDERIMLAGPLVIEALNREWWRSRWCLSGVTLSAALKIIRETRR